MREQAKPPAGASSPAPAGSETLWEYAVLQVDFGANEPILDSMGRHGWEMCGCHTARDGDVRLYFKRELSPNAPASATPNEGGSHGS